ncbi:thiamine diphosphokinase [Trichococcus pasteurii]|uniref:Thiamine diphosphokinase n=1 Tax=Trichococcus pasteurii TaxID=43064 RepID=A0A1W1ICI4_9LACT|nr:thiamine diphosphokinase [Trichococcus pasteurii]SFE39450.1 thiamine pyrophosphokinase [Trichococcus pasteurii]SLM50777.1 thiamin pyrophosphokinase [Trichococcus pasteurii]SSB91658.1 thiamin pyrophosphokinase [Trichococcus pasteurii]
MQSEKVLIVVGGDQTDVADLVHRYSVSHRLIGADRGALKLAELLTNFDAAIGDFDSVTPTEMEDIKKKSRVCRVLPAQKDETDTEAAIAYAIEAFHPEEIILLGAFGGRLDHLMSNLWLAFHPLVKGMAGKISLIDLHNTLRFYMPGSYALEKESDKKYLSFIGLTPIKKLTLTEVVYPLHGKDYEYPIALVSNEFEGTEMHFSFESGLLAVIQSSDKRK